MQDEASPTCLPTNDSNSPKRVICTKWSRREEKGHIKATSPLTTLRCYATQSTNILS